MEKPIQYVLVGLPFAGKTVLASELSRQLGFLRVNLDEIKFAHGFEGVSDDDVSPEAWEKIFDESDSTVLRFLRMGQSVLNETAWMTRLWRDRAREVASDAAFPTRTIFVDTPEEIVRARWIRNRESKERFDVADNVFESALRVFEPPTEDEDVIVFDSSIPLEKWIKRNF